MFWEELVNLLKHLPETQIFHTTLNEENATSDYCTWFLRILTAAHLKSDPDRFVPFLEGDYCDIATFCSREVEPMGKECGMVQVLALAECLAVKVTIEYMDGRELVGGKLTKHVYGPVTSGTLLTLLYRPGHYDILYAD
jgi:ubiquitin thioesterase protein OTUB1